VDQVVQPAFRAIDIASTQLFPETSAVPGISLSVSRQRNLSNNFIVDGLSANDDAAALSGMTYTADAVDPACATVCTASRPTTRAVRAA
jgi:hypothetical protein